MANSGYLTRRLVDVANDCIITTEDCRTKHGVTVQAENRRRSVVSSLTELILGRTTAEDIKHPETGEILLRRGKEVTEDLAEKIENSHVQKCACVRSCCANSPTAFAASAMGEISPAARASISAKLSASSGAVDRRTWHAVHHAHLPHRWCGAGGGPVQDRSQL